jgi:hypothetical protein
MITKTTLNTLLPFACYETSVRYFELCSAGGVGASPNTATSSEPVAEGAGTMRSQSMERKSSKDKGLHIGTALLEPVEKVLLEIEHTTFSAYVPNTSTNIRFDFCVEEYGKEMW